MSRPDRQACLEMDRRDPLGPLRAEFELDPSVVYLDGNSLGALTRRARERVEETVRDEWGRGLIRSWNAAGWVDAPRRLGDRLAPLLGARPGRVVVADSTTVNIFKLLAAALDARPGRPAILTEAGNFPTDVYVAEGLARRRPGTLLRSVDRERLEESLDGSVAVLMLSHVDYRLGRMHDVAALTAAAHRAGALALWDLSHSAGAVHVQLDDWGVDLAVGCTYKYLNGGPGSPAYLYVGNELEGGLRSPVAGWFGHADPFRFAPRYEPAPGIERWLAGTPPILALAALEGSLEVWERVDLAAVRRKSIALSELMMELADARLDEAGVAVVSPRAAAERGSQVCLAHPQGRALMGALIERGVIGDFRPPDVMRFGLPALYTRFVDVFDAVAQLEDVLASGAHLAERFRSPARVT